MKKMAPSIIKNRFKTIPISKKTLLTKLKEINAFDLLFIGISIYPIGALVMMIISVMGG